MTPTDDSSRFSAIPLTPLEKATISPVITPDRPWTRAIPSPTSRTRPTSVRVTSAWNCSISRWMTEVISSALNFMGLPFDQSSAELFEVAADRGVVDVVADLDDQAADERRVDLVTDDRGGAADQAGQAAAQRLALALVERDGRPYGHRHAVLAAVPEGPGLPGDRRQEPQAAVTVQDLEEPRHHRGHPTLEGLGHDALLDVGGD